MGEYSNHGTESREAFVRHEPSGTISKSHLAAMYVGEMRGRALFWSGKFFNQTSARCTCVFSFGTRPLHAARACFRLKPDRCTLHGCVFI